VRVEGYSPLKTVDLGDARIGEIAVAHEATPAQVVIRWHIEHEIVVIPKSTHPARIAENRDVFGFHLEQAEVSALDGMGRG
jgi:diketogulonate reductase-like aldo/keto reductase